MEDYSNEFERQQIRRHPRAKFDNPRQVIHVRQQPSGKYLIQEIECDDQEREHLGGLTGFQSQKVELTYDQIEAMQKAFRFNRINRFY